MANEELHTSNDELRAAEEAIKRSFEQINLLINNLPGYAFFKDANLRYVMLNNKACQLLGRPREDIVGKDDFELFPAQYAEKYSIDDRRVLESGEPLLVDNEENEENGQPVILSTRKVPIKDGGGKVTGLIGLSIDITERKRAEDAVAAAHRQIQSIIDNTPAIVYAFDLEERFVMANASVAELLNSTPERMIGKRRHEFMPKEDADWHEANDCKVIEAGRALSSRSIVSLRTARFHGLQRSFHFATCR